MSLPRFSIITISYNQAPFLERAIRSVIEQKGVNLEYIVLDPGSTDGSREIIERYRDRIDHVVFERDAGPADGLNKGLALATGEYLGYLNSDDELLPDALAEAAAILASRPGIDVVYGNGIQVDGEGRHQRRLIPSRFMSAPLYARGLAIIIQQAAFLRTEALRRAGGFNAANGTCWDGEAFLEIARNGGRFHRVWRDWGLFRIYDGSISGSGRLNDRYRLDCERQFRSVFGRDAGAADAWLQSLLRIGLLAADPRGTIAKLGNRLGLGGVRQRV